MAFDERITPISYAVRLPVVAKYIGQIGLMLVLLTLPPLIVSLLFSEYDFSFRFLVVIAVLGIAGIPLARLPEPDHLQANEGLVITALAFVLTPLLMSYPLMASGIAFDDALFEAVSGITTTGLSSLASVEDMPRTFVFTRAWMQWYGGLGIVVLSVSLLMGYQVASRRLIDPEAASPYLVSTSRAHARHVLIVYVALSLLGFVMVWLSVRDGFTALTLLLSAVSTGGFAPFDNSLAGLNNTHTAFILLLIGVVSAITIPVFYRAWQRGWRSLVKDIELRTLLLLVVGISISLAASLKFNLGMSWQDAGTHGLLLGMSAQSTTGFSTLDIAQLDPASMLLMIPSMLLGGSIGSTAGGIKLLRLLILLRLLQLWLRRTGAPSHAVIEPWFAGRRLENDELLRVLVVMSLFILVVLISWLIFVFAGYPPLNALFEVISATGTVGLSSGITGPDLHPLLKGVLCLDMLAGRVEVLALLVLLFPGTWFGKRTSSS
jgi:trk system potassium uptake protein TrkH